MIESPRGKTQRGFSGMAATLMALLAATVAGTVFMTSSARLAQSESAARGLDVEGAAKAAQEWGRLRAEKGECLPLAVFDGENSLPGFVGVRAQTTCLAEGPDEGPKSYLVETIACTASECPAASPFPPQYAERRISARYGKTRTDGVMSKAALIEWARFLGAVRLWDFEENGRVLMDTESRTAAPTTVLHIKADQPEGAAPIDSSPNPKILTAHGTANIMRSSFAMGGGSIELNGESDRVVVGPSGDLYVPEGADFSLSLWALARTFVPTTTGTPPVFLLHSNDPKGLWVQQHGRSVRIGVGGTTFMTSSTAATTISLNGNVWTHVTISRRDGFVRLFVAGSLIGSYAYSGEIDWTGGLTIGRGHGGEGAGYDGLIDDVRLVVGEAEEFESHVPPAQDVPNDKWEWDVSCTNVSYPGNQTPDASFWRNPVFQHRTDGFVPATATSPQFKCFENSSTGTVWHTVEGEAGKPLGTGDFAIEAHFPESAGVASTTVMGFLAGDWNSATGGWRIDKPTSGATRAVRVEFSDGTNVVQRSITIGTSSLIFVTRKDGWLRIFHNGALQQETYFPHDIPAPTGKLWIGRDPENLSVKGSGSITYSIRGMRSRPVWTRTGSAPSSIAESFLATRHVAANSARLIIDPEKGITDISPRPASLSNYGASIGRDEEVGAYIRFDGNSRVVVDSSDGRFVFGFEARRAELMVMFDQASMGREACFLDFGDGLFCKTATDVLVFNGKAVPSTAFKVKAGVWQRIDYARTSNGSSAGGRVYINGIDVQDGSSATFPLLRGGAALSIGAKLDGSAAMSGRIGRLRISALNTNSGNWTRSARFSSPRDAIYMPFDETDTTDVFYKNEASGFHSPSDSCNFASTCIPDGGDAAFGRTGGRNGVRTGWMPEAFGINPPESFFSMDFWMKPDELPPPGSKTEPVHITGSSLGGNVLPSNGLIHGFVAYPDGSLSFYSTEGTILCRAGSVAANRWSHIATAYLNGVRKVFIDGESCSDWSASSTHPGYINLGMSATTLTSPSSAFKGKIDEFRVRIGSPAWLDSFHPRKPLKQSEPRKRSLILEKVAGAHAEVVAGTAVPWTDDLGVRAAELTADSRISAPPVKGGELSDGASIVVLANPAASSVFGSRENASMARAGSVRVGAANMLALMRSGESQEFIFGAGSGAGEWDGPESIGGAMGPADKWGLYVGAAGADGGGAVSKNGKVVGEGAGHPVSSESRPFFSIGGDLSGGSVFEGDMGLVAVFGRRLTPAEQALLQEGFSSGRLPEELAFRSDDATLTDRVGGTISSSGVTADPEGDAAGAAWVFSGEAGQGVSVDAGRAPGTGDFSAEAFVRIDRTPADSEIVSVGGLSLRVGGGGRLRATFAGQEVAAGPIIQIGQWQRLSMSRRSGVLTIRAGRFEGSPVAFAESLTGELSVGGSAGKRPIVGRMRDVRAWFGVAPN